MTSGYSAAVVTFRRPTSLASVLNSLKDQESPPNVIVVADNDPLESARKTVERVGQESSCRILYIATGSNLGPAGGWATAASVAKLEGDRGDWLLLVDDDDPLPDSKLLTDLLVAASMEDDDVAGIGPAGARLLRSRAELIKVRPASGTSEDVDYLPSGIAPLYRWSCLDTLSFFREDLFFGFEDLEMGLRLKNAGWRLSVFSRSRPQSLNRESSRPTSQSTSPGVPWREYYKVRALIWVLREHVGNGAALIAFGRSGLAGAVVAAIRGRSSEIMVARVLGAWDGWRGSLGLRRYYPEINPPKGLMDDIGPC